jgi:multimeric flavodoxin WrbA
MNSTIALFASSRRNGNTGRLIDRLADELAIDVVDLGRKNISAFDYEHKNRGDDFIPLMERILGHQNIIFSSPVYWYAVSPPMKIFLDRISDFLIVPELLEQGRRLRGKTGFVVCTSIADEVSSTYREAFTETFAYLGMHFGGLLHANCGFGYLAEKYEGDVQAFVQKIKLPTI